MRLSATLVAAAAALISLSGNCPAMGSGPHPNVPFGIPPPPARVLSGVGTDQPVSTTSGLLALAINRWVLAIFVLLPSLLLISAKLLIWTLQKFIKK